MSVTSLPATRMRPCVRPLQPGDHAEGRALAAAGGAEEGDEAAGREIEADTVDGVDAGVGAAEALELELRRAALGHCRQPCGSLPASRFGARWPLDRHAFGSR